MVIYYPTFFLKDGKYYVVFVPDLDVNTQGTSIEDAVEMAKDVIGITVVELERKGKSVPAPSDYNGAYEKAKADTEIVDYSKGFLKNVELDLEKFTKEYDAINK